MAALLIGAYYYVAPGLPQAAELRDIKIQVPLQVYSRDGRLIDEFGEQKRPRRLRDIPPLLIKPCRRRGRALLRAPRHRSWGDRGAINELRRPAQGRRQHDHAAGAADARRSRERDSTRGSTGSSRSTRSDPRVSHGAGITKEEISSSILNTTFFGQRAYGVATAAQTYFGKNLDALSVSEIAILAGIPQRPTDGTLDSIDNATTRRLRAAAHERDRRDRRRRVRSGARGAHRRQAVRLAVAARGALRRRDGRAEMVARFGNAATTAGLKVTTTIDSRLQAAANRAMRANLMAYDERHGYRGPLAHVELPAGAVERADPLAYTESTPRRCARCSTTIPPCSTTRARSCCRRRRARVFFADHGEESIGLDAVEWAATVHQRRHDRGRSRRRSPRF